MLGSTPSIARMTDRLRLPFGLILGLALLSCAAPVAPSTSASATRLRADLEWLAAPEREGRRAGTQGADDAADYLARRFQEIGAVPAGEDGTWFQTFALPPSRRLARTPSLVLAADEDEAGGSPSDARAVLVPALSSAPGVVEEEIALIDASASDPSSWIGHAGRIVLVAASARSAESAAAVGPHGSLGALRPLAFSAKQSGAGALLVELARGEEPEADDGLARDVGLPAAWVRHGAARALAGRRARFDPGVELEERTTRNVLALLPAGDPAAEILVVGAHYDHLGFGGADSLAPGSRAIHHGADDNASGTALLLDLARRLAPRARTLGRSVLLAAWGAEELGLLGSAHWTKHSTVPWERVVANLNFDMVGRSGGRKVDVGSAASSSVFESALQEANAAMPRPLVLRLSTKSRSVGGSDHMSFLAARRPALFFFTGIHTDYHKPSDTPEKIEYETLAEIADLAEGTIDRLADALAIDFVEPPEDPAESRPAGGAEQGLGASLGTIPDYGAEDGGLVLQGVTAGSAAAEAGLRAGDTLLRLGEFRIGDVYDLTEALRRHAPGDEVTLEYRRGSETLTARVTLKSRRR